MLRETQAKLLYHVYCGCWKAGDLFWPWKTWPRRFEDPQGRLHPLLNFHGNRRAATWEESPKSSARELLGKERAHIPDLAAETAARERADGKLS